MRYSSGRGSQAVGELGGDVALEAVDVLGAVELAAEVGERALVDLLDEDHRDPGVPRARDEVEDPRVAGVAAGHVRDARVLLHDPALLHVDDDERGLSVKLQERGLLLKRKGPGDVMSPGLLSLRVNAAM